MKQRTLGCLVTLMAGMALGLRAEGEVHLAMATLAPAGSTWMQVFASANRELRRKTSNALSLRWYPGGVQGDEAELVRKVQNGRLAGAALTSVGLSKLYSPVQVLALPGMFSSPESLLRAQERLRPELEQSFQQAGVTLLGFGATGGPRIFSTQPVRSPQDLAARHPWQWADDTVLPTLYQQIGATGVVLQVPEVLGALQTQRVDTVFVSPVAAIALQWAPSFQYYSDQSASASLGGIVVSNTALQGLPADQQQALREVFASYMPLLGRNLRTAEGHAHEALQAQGLQPVTLTRSEQQAWQQVFSNLRHSLVGTLGDQSWFDRVAQAGRE